MKLAFGFGNTVQQVELPDSNLLQELHAQVTEAAPDGENEVRRALAEPIGSGRLRDIVKPGETVAVISSDITRPMPTAKVMPLILEELYAAGIRKEDITLVFGLGIHREHTAEEKRRLAGERAWADIRVVDSYPKEVVRLGVTRQGTPVDIDARVARADRRVCLGNIEYHYFAGYSGGGKAIMPGVSTGAAIENNHRMMVRENARAGQLAGNPIREDIEEAAALAGIDFILNVVLDEKKKIIHAAAGHYIEAHREACAFLDTLYKVRIEKQADIVVASAGGYPKDINLYQAQKALDNAKHACRDGGIIILCACCKEGLGEEVFERWMTGFPCPADMVKEIACRFELGGHKAAAISMVLGTKRIFLVSDMESDFVKRMFLEPYGDLQQAFDDAVAQLGEDATCVVMPYAGSTLPEIK